MGSPLSPEQLRKMHAFWRAANYLSVGQIYLFDNPLLKEPLQLKHVKPRLLGHWGTTPGAPARVPQLGSRAAYLQQTIRDKLIEHKRYICERGDDMPEIRDWKWGQRGAADKAQAGNAAADNA